MHRLRDSDPVARPTERWGWATYHYGRWGFKEDIGWYWVPGTVWAPAWVSWRKSPKHVAWAPLPPGRHTVYVTETVDIEPDAIPAIYWRVVPVGSFLAEDLSSEIVIGDEARPLIRETRPAGSVRVRKDVVVDDVIEPEFVEKQANVKVVVHEAREARTEDEAGRVNDREVVLFKPSVDRGSVETWKPKDVKTVDEVRVDRKQAIGGQGTRTKSGVSGTGTETGATGGQAAVQCFKQAEEGLCRDEAEPIIDESDKRADTGTARERREQAEEVISGRAGQRLGRDSRLGSVRRSAALRRRQEEESVSSFSRPKLRNIRAHRRGRDRRQQVEEQNRRT
jgi:hypothetical protein